ncbi:hypothetical protein VNI00_007164 [Paramarasmius palmivorus]|uniref:Uncharacterized protein n=1 Tax=Paramarasmius palmivorus TaxID=297713 RepID=A0AAW0D098_9AGAR
MDAALGLAGAIIVTIGLSNTYDESKYNIYFDGDLINFVYNVVSAANNFTITLLTGELDLNVCTLKKTYTLYMIAGRIWWIHRQVRIQTPAVLTSDKLVQSVSRIIIESGVIYPIVQIVSVIAINTSPGLGVTFDFLPLATLSAAIAPTLILVRGRLGKNVESLQDTVSNIQFTSRVLVHDGADTISSPTRAHSVGIFSMVEPKLERDEETAEKA